MGMRSNGLHEIIASVERNWNKRDYYIAEFAFNEDRTPVLARANATFLRLFALTEEDFGKNSEVVLGESFVALAAACALRYDRGMGFECKAAVRELDDRLWNVALYHNAHVMALIGRMSRSLEPMLKTNACRIGLEALTPFNVGSVLLRRAESGAYVVSSYDRRLEELLPIADGASFDAIMDRRFDRLRSGRIFDRCLSEMQPVRLMDRFADQDGDIARSCPVILEIYPASHGDESLIFLRMYLPDEDTFYNVHNVDESAFADSIPDGAAVLLTELRGDGSFAIQFYSEKFDALLRDYPTLLEDTMSSSAVSGSIAQNRLVSCDLLIESRDGQQHKFFIYSVPEEEGKRLLVSLVPREAEKAQGPDIYSRLTPREREIIQLVVEGYTNKYIAHSLTISEGTVKKTVYNCYHKLGISSRIELIKLVLG